METCVIIATVGFSAAIVLVTIVAVCLMSRDTE